MGIASTGMSENEQKQQMSIAYVHAVAARAGFACQVVTIDDDSVDVQLAARGRVNEHSILRSPKIDLQLKATSRPILRDQHLAFPLPVKNFNELRQEALVPRLLVVLFLAEDKTQWLEQWEEQMITRHCAYWTTLLGRSESKNQKSVTISLSRSQQFTATNLHLLMEKVARRELL